MKLLAILAAGSGLDATAEQIQIDAARSQRCFFGKLEADGKHYQLFMFGMFEVRG